MSSIKLFRKKSWVIEPLLGSNLKRISSKEDVFEFANAFFHTPPAARKNLRKSNNFSWTDFEQVLREKQVQIKAMEVLASAHCAETLCCLIDLFRLEDASDSKQRNNIKTQMFSMYIADDAVCQVCLPGELRVQLLSNTNDFAELKRHLLNDLRFNDRLLKILGIL